MQTSRWLIEHLLHAEHAQRAVALVRHHVKAARFALHRYLAGFDFEASKVHQKLARQLSTLEFTETAQNVFAHRRAWHWQGASGGRHRGAENRGKRQKAKGKRQTGTSLFDGRFGQWLEKEIREGKARRTALALMRLDIVILNGLGYLPFSQAGGALLFHLLSKLYEHTSVASTTSLSFSDGSAVVGDARVTTTLPDRLNHHCHIVETGNECYRFGRSTMAAKTRMKAWESARNGKRFAGLRTGHAQGERIKGFSIYKGRIPINCAKQARLKPA